MTSEKEIYEVLLEENEQLRNNRDQQECFHKAWVDHADFVQDHLVKQTQAMESIAHSLADISNRPYLNANKE